MTPEQWCEVADQALSRTDKRRAGESRASPRVVMVGAYNTAKTSLLRRLLVDEGLPVPDWARVSAREETSATNDVEVVNCTLIDTPGLEALSRWHATATREALDDADAIMLLTTSNLFATDDALELPDEDYMRPIDVLSGKVFADPGVTFPPGSLAILVTRFDESSGLDPSDFPEAFDESRVAKLEELHNLLREHAPEAAKTCWKAAVASDPFGRTGNRSASREDFDAYRDWDGMAEVVEWLRELAAKAPELGRWREVRVRAVDLNRDVNGLAGQLSDAQQRAAEAIAGTSECSRIISKCEREKEAAVTRLSAAVDRAVYSTPGPDDEHFEIELRSLLQQELANWAKETKEAIARLAEECEESVLEIGDPDTSAAAERLIKQAGSPRNWQEKSESVRKYLELVRRGLSVLKVEHEGQPSVFDLGDITKWFSLSATRVRELEHLIHVATAFLGLAEEAGQVRAMERARHRAKLIEQSKTVASEMFASEGSPGGWEDLFNHLGGAAEEGRAVWLNAQQSAEEEQQALVASLTHLRGLLDSCPQPSSS